MESQWMSQHASETFLSLQAFTGTCGWSMNSRGTCRAPRRCSPTVLETAVGSSRSRTSGRSTTWECPWQEPVTRQSGTTMCPNCTSSSLENKQEKQQPSNIQQEKFPQREVVNTLTVFLFVLNIFPVPELLKPLKWSLVFHNKVVKHWNTFPVSDPLLQFFRIYKLKISNFFVGCWWRDPQPLSWCDEHFIYKYN